MTDYSPEELFPLLGRISRRYTSNESSSISYAKAQQLMGSILYCINGIYEDATLSTFSPPSASFAYKTGFQKRMKKIEKAKQIYQQILNGYLPIENEFCDDTLLHGIPIFFERYNLEFHAQDHLLTLDYPLHKYFEGLTGIDLIYAYLLCFLEEQNTVSRYPLPVIQQVLKEYHPDYKSLPVNIYSVILEHSDRCEYLSQNPDILWDLRNESESIPMTASFKDGQPMSDEELRTVMKELSSCQYISDKIIMIKESVHSLCDLRELLNECIWPEEYSEIFSMLSSLEIDYFLDEIREKREFGQSLTSWETAVLKYASKSDHM